MANPHKTPRRIRSDGWTLPRQRQFIKMLALTGSVETSAANAQMSAWSAYRLRLHPDAAPFRRAWEAALEACPSSLREIAFERAINGTSKPVYENGILVGHEPVFNDRLLMFLLRRYDTRSQRSPQQVILESFERLVEIDDPAAEIITAPLDEAVGNTQSEAAPDVNLV